MQWNSISEFIFMNGHGFYVWSAYGIALALLVGEVFSHKARRGRIVRQAAREAQLSRRRARPQR